DPSPPCAQFAGAACGALRADRRMARPDGGADGPTGRARARAARPRRKLRPAAAAAGRQLERGPPDRARAAPAGWTAAARGRRRRDGILRWQRARVRERPGLIQVIPGWLVAIPEATIT